MAPRAKVTKENILDAALCIVRESGMDALNVRAVAGRLGVSTQPVFSNYESMDELKKEVIEMAGKIYMKLTEKMMSSGEYPPYKASGMAYIEFANEEKELFKLLFMRNRTPREMQGGFSGYEHIIGIMQKNLGLDKQRAEMLHLEMWCFTHGIAAMHATSYLEFDMETVSRMMTDMYEGLKHKYTKEE